MKWEILKQFSSKKMYGFTFKDVLREFPERNPNYLAWKLKTMVDNGMLLRISRDNYHIIPLEKDPDHYVPDSYQVAKYLMQKKEYYIGYASAIQIHGLNLPGQSLPGQSLPGQSPNKYAFKRKKYHKQMLKPEAWVWVVTRKQMKPAIRCCKGTTCQFITHDDSRFFGFNNLWINHREEAMVSDLEKTIVDILTKPQLCGGIIEIGSTIFQAKDQTDREKLFYYFARNMNKSAKKRYLFLADLLDLGWSPDHDRMLTEIGPSITILDPTSKAQGRKRTRFGLQINVDPILIKNRVFYGKKS